MGEGYIGHHCTPFTTSWRAKIISKYKDKETGWQVKFEFQIKQ